LRGVLKETTMRVSTVCLLGALGAFWAVAVAVTASTVEEHSMEHSVVQLIDLGQASGADPQTGDGTGGVNEDEKEQTGIEAEAAENGADGLKQPADANAQPPVDDGAGDKPDAAPGVPDAAKTGTQSAQTKVQQGLDAVKKAKDDVVKATETLSKDDVQTAHDAAKAAKDATNAVDAEKAVVVNEENAADESQKEEDQEQKDENQEATDVAKETAKLVESKMDEAVKEADKEAKKDGKEKADAIIEKAKEKGMSKNEKTLAQARKALKTARDEHAKAVKKMADAKVKAGLASVDFKAEAKAIEGMKKQVELANVPISEDDMREKSHLSAVDKAKRAADERVIAYRDHMAAAHAADREAAASQSLLDVEEQISSLTQQVNAHRIRVRELQGIVKEARFDAEEVKARAKFTTQGSMAKLKYNEINENNEIEVSSQETELTSQRKKLLLSDKALTQLKNGNVLSNAQKREKDALSDLALADAHARMGAHKFHEAQEIADKAQKLTVAKNEKIKAEKAVKAKKHADVLLAAQKKVLQLDNKVKNAASTVKKTMTHGEKGEKAAVQAKIASEKAEKADENKNRLKKMEAKERDAKGIEKEKKVNEQGAKKLEKVELAKEKTAKAAKADEIKVKTGAAELTMKSSGKEKDSKRLKMEAGAEAAAKGDKKEMATKAELEKTSAEERDKQNEANEKIKAASAKGSPCDTCLAKCTTKVCRTWCNAQWCEGTRHTSGTKEIKQKLTIAKEHQSKAKEKQEKSKEKLDNDEHAEQKARGDAKNALSKAAETGKSVDMQNAREETEDVVHEQHQVKEDKREEHKEEEEVQEDDTEEQNVEVKTEYSGHNR